MSDASIPGPASYPGPITMAIAALGTAAFALVDTSKAFLPNGGISNVGFGAIRRAYEILFGVGALKQKRSCGASKDTPSPDPLKDTLLRDLATLHGNWINGRPMADQQAIAKSLVKLRLDGATARSLASATRVDAGILQRVGEKMSAGEPLDDAETNVLGRFDLGLASFIDDAYQHADQQYRNWSRFAAMVVAVAVAVVGGLAIHVDLGPCVLAGLLATPIAPISKDLTSALAAGVKVAQAIRR